MKPQPHIYDLHTGDPGPSNPAEIHAYANGTLAAVVRVSFEGEGDVLTVKIEREIPYVPISIRLPERGATPYIRHGDVWQVISPAKGHHP